MDLFAGSGTTLEAARINGRNFVGVDRCPLTVNLARRRLAGSEYRLILPPCEGAPRCEASVEPGVGLLPRDAQRIRPGAGRDAGGRGGHGRRGQLVGRLSARGMAYHCMAQFARSRREPALKLELDAPVYAGDLALCVGDITGKSFYYRLDPNR